MIALMGMMMGIDTSKPVVDAGINQNWKEPNKLLAWANAPKGVDTRWSKGKYPGTTGRPKKTPADYMLQDQCRNHADEAMQVILSIMRGSDDDAVRLKAAQTILDRGFGKAVQQTQLTNVDSEGNTLDMNHTILFVAAQPKCINPD